MSDVVSGEGFQIERIEEHSSDEQELVRVEFDPGKAFLFRDAYVICDPLREWAFIEYGWTSQILQKQVLLEYGDTTNGVPIVTRMNETGTWIDQPENVDTVVMTQEILDTNVSDDVFRLSAYGLPEPNFERSSSTTWLVYLIGGAICLAVAYWIRQRQQTTS